MRALAREVRDAGYFVETSADGHVFEIRESADSPEILTTITAHGDTHRFTPRKARTQLVKRGILEGRKSMARGNYNLATEEQSDALRNRMKAVMEAKQLDVAGLANEAIRIMASAPEEIEQFGGGTPEKPKSQNPQGVAYMSIRALTREGRNAHMENIERWTFVLDALEKGEAPAPKPKAQPEPEPEEQQPEAAVETEPEPTAADEQILNELRAEIEKLHGDLETAERLMHEAETKRVQEAEQHSATKASYQEVVGELKRAKTENERLNEDLASARQEAGAVASLNGRPAWADDYALMLLAEVREGRATLDTEMLSRLDRLVALA